MKLNLLILSVALCVVLGLSSAIDAQQWTKEIVKTAINGWILPGNFDNDTDIDLLIANGDSLFWYENLQPGWSVHLIDAQFFDASQVNVFDMDLDGDLDLLQLSGSPNTIGTITWNENIMNGTQWIKHIISDSVVQTANMANGYGDIDGDTDIDFAVPSPGDGSILWFENIKGDTTWQEHKIGVIGGYAVWTTLTDIDNDNDLDIIGARYDSGNIIWYENQLPDTTWSPHPIAILPGTVQGFGVDIDSDGDLDIITHSNVTNVLIWYDNPTWESHLIYSGTERLNIGYVGDIDGNGHPDVTFSNGNYIGWSKNMGNTVSWETFMIDSLNNKLPLPTGLADINGDGNLDITVATFDTVTYEGDERWYANPYVYIKVPEDYATIQEGINAAKDGNIVLVSEGTYYENINFKGKAITVASQFYLDQDTSHISKTIIDGSKPSDPNKASVVTFESGEDTNSVIMGFTIIGGSGTLSEYIKGGGIFINNSSASILNNVIRNNVINAKNNQAYGGGICCHSNPQNNEPTIIYNNTIIYNKALTNTEPGGYGGGVDIWQSDVIMKYNTITHNEVGGGEICYGPGVKLTYSTAKSIIDNNIISFNTFSNSQTGTGALFLVYTNGVKVLNNIFEGNSGIIGGGLNLTQTKGGTISNNIFKGNSAMVGGGIFSSNSNSVIEKNKFINNYADTTGGGICVAGNSNLEIKNNLIVNNKAFAAGGIGIYFDSNPKVINNTITKNKAIYGGGFDFQFNCKPVIMNSIIYGNTADSSGNNIFLSDSTNVIAFAYCDVEGGIADFGIYENAFSFSGTYENNIDYDPLFADDSLFKLADGSPCIDAGNPNPLFNDIEDPGHPGFALFPALGTIRNDIGTYGGNPYADFQVELKGAQFSAFVNRVNSVINKQAVIDSFMNAATSFPFIEDKTIVYFIYQGEAQSVNVPADVNGWSENAYPMTKLAGTNFWYFEVVFENDARINYQFLLDGDTWILDPLNPNQIYGAFVYDSELAMPDYIQPPEIEYYPNISHGTLTSFSFHSNVLGNDRIIEVYTPFNYEIQSSQDFPVVLLHDGLAYLKDSTAKNILDYLIANKKIEPVIGLFVPPVDRDNEYGYEKTSEFESCIINELIPYIDSTYRIASDPLKRAIGGFSLGGLITTQICYNNPDVFGLAAMFSPSYKPYNKLVYNSVLNGQKKNIKWYLDWGTYEPQDILINAKAFKDILSNKGYDLNWNEWHEAHSWGNWRAHLDNALIYFFPGDSTSVSVEKELNLPDKFSLSQNYPNPFNPTTTIKYSIPAEVKSQNLKVKNVTLKIYDILGREIALLVNEEQKPGYYEVKWVASNQPSGVYFYRITAGDYVKTKKMILLR